MIQYDPNTLENRGRPKGGPKILVYIYIYIYIYIPQTVSTVGVLTVYLLNGCLAPWISLLYVCELLCAGCGLGEGRVAPVYAKRRVAQLSMKKHICFSTFCLQDPFGLLGASWVPPGCFWVSPGCLWVSPGYLLGVSWFPPLPCQATDASDRIPRVIRLFDVKIV